MVETTWSPTADAQPRIAMASSLRQLELFAVNLDDDSDNDDAFSLASRAPTVSSSRASLASVENVKNRDKKRRARTSPSEQQPHLTSCVHAIICVVCRAPF